MFALAGASDCQNCLTHESSVLMRIFLVNVALIVRNPVKHQ